jgi:hypothetical protein
VVLMEGLMAAAAAVVVVVGAVPTRSCSSRWGPRSCRGCSGLNVRNVRWLHAMSSCQSVH